METEQKTTALDDLSKLISCFVLNVESNDNFIDITARSLAGRYYRFSVSVDKEGKLDVMTLGNTDV